MVEEEGGAEEGTEDTKEGTEEEAAFRIATTALVKAAPKPDRSPASTYWRASMSPSVVFSSWARSVALSSPLDFLPSLAWPNSPVTCCRKILEGGNKNAMSGGFDRAGGRAESKQTFERRHCP